VNGRLAAAAFRLASSTGGKVAGLFHSLAARAADVGRLERERRALTAQARASAWVVGSLPVAVLVMLRPPDGRAPCWATPPGPSCWPGVGPGGGRGGGRLADGAEGGPVTATLAVLVGLGASIAARRAPRVGRPSLSAPWRPWQSWPRSRASPPRRRWVAGSSPAACAGPVSKRSPQRATWCCSLTWWHWAWAPG